MIKRIILWFIHRYFAEYVLIPKQEFPIRDREPDDIGAMLDSILYEEVLSFARNIEGSKSLGEYKRVYVKTAIQAERRRLGLDPWPERDINLAIELAIRDL